MLSFQFSGTSFLSVPFWSPSAWTDRARLFFSHLRQDLIFLPLLSHTHLERNTAEAPAPQAIAITTGTEDWK